MASQGRRDTRRAFGCIEHAWCKSIISWALAMDNLLYALDVVRRNHPVIERRQLPRGHAVHGLCLSRRFVITTFVTNPTSQPTQHPSSMSK